jgi:hypothetical protein
VYYLTTYIAGKRRGRLQGMAERAERRTLRQKNRIRA